MATDSNPPAAPATPPDENETKLKRLIREAMDEREAELEANRPKPKTLWESIFGVPAE